ncbi:uncharacterized protein [Physcomitrium patens]|uniref:Uncharacterized protein n=1 Tax=Physcomitrium patens TaxID=3218 RepID=A0A2K1JXZ3_PHYPA|nr:uncharacterized protein LOC112287477 [Physcomitrium patens]XP_024386266.1 uncharacterized protein LOC112287477 [Physcomitrium patens]PNR46390.1 hypothetical protein PHYPA_013509 [Physcomitrium patens]|eukprot:XP_024386265.1 uncharacterized protein LOC112287477 [Physcomitrella patens]
MSSAWPKDCSTDRSSCQWTMHKNQTHSPYGSRGKETDSSASSIQVYSEHTGDPCASPPDWAHHPCLKTVPPQDRSIFRQKNILKWMGEYISPTPSESFCDYITRCIATAEQELKMQKKLHIGDDYHHHVDKLVFKLFYGSRIAMQRLGIQQKLGTEELVLRLLREECASQISQGFLRLDPSSFNNSSKTPTWPSREDVALHTVQQMPPGVENLAEMDSR